MKKMMIFFVVKSCTAKHKTDSFHTLGLTVQKIVFHESTFLGGQLKLDTNFSPIPWEIWKGPLALYYYLLSLSLAHLSLQKPFFSVSRASGRFHQASMKIQMEKFGYISQRK